MRLGLNSIPILINSFFNFVNFFKNNKIKYKKGLYYIFFYLIDKIILLLNILILPFISPPSLNWKYFIFIIYITSCKPYFKIHIISFIMNKILYFKWYFNYLICQFFKILNFNRILYKFINLFSIITFYMRKEI